MRLSRLSRAVWTDFLCRAAIVFLAAQVLVCLIGLLTVVVNFPGVGTAVLVRILPEIILVAWPWTAGAALVLGAILTIHVLGRDGHLLWVAQTGRDVRRALLPLMCPALVLMPLLVIWTGWISPMALARSEGALASDIENRWFLAQALQEGLALGPYGYLRWRMDAEGGLRDVVAAQTEAETGARLMLLARSGSIASRRANWIDLDLHSVRSVGFGSAEAGELRPVTLDLRAEGLHVRVPLAQIMPNRRSSLERSALLTSWELWRLRAVVSAWYRIGHRLGRRADRVYQHRYLAIAHRVQVALFPFLAIAFGICLTRLPSRGQSAIGWRALGLIALAGSVLLVGAVRPERFPGVLLLAPSVLLLGGMLSRLRPPGPNRLFSVLLRRFLGRQWLVTAGILWGLFVVHVASGGELRQALRRTVDGAEAAMTAGLVTGVAWTLLGLSREGQLACILQSGRRGRRQLGWALLIAWLSAGLALTWCVGRGHSRLGSTRDTVAVSDSSHAWLHDGELWHRIAWEEPGGFEQNRPPPDATQVTDRLRRQAWMVGGTSGPAQWLGRWGRVYFPLWLGLLTMGLCLLAPRKHLASVAWPLGAAVAAAASGTVIGILGAWRGAMVIPLHGILVTLTLIPLVCVWRRWHRVGWRW